MKIRMVGFQAVLLSFAVDWQGESLAFKPASRMSHTRRLRQLCAHSIAHDDAETSFPSAEGALKSQGLARSIRKHRACRGRVSLPPVSGGHNESETPRPSATRKVARKVPTSGKDLSYESAIVALRAYYSIHSDLVIPRRFIVPCTQDYPNEWHGLDLSSTVYDMKWWQRHVRHNPHRVEELNKLGFVWERLQPEWNLVLEALVIYSSLNGDVLVPVTFVVPPGSDNYPKSTWGIPLGSCIFRIRSRNDYLRGSNAASRRAQLDGLGFVWDVNDYLFRKFYSALRHFAKMERQQSGDGSVKIRALRVPSTFVVPHGNHHGWPPALWGYPLGAKCSAVRQKQLYVKNDPERQRALAELGFQWSGNATLGWLEVVHAAAIYSKMHQRDLDVPYHFVVPAPPQISIEGCDEERDLGITGSDDAWPWPEQLWGLPLGQRLKDIRLKGAYLSGTAGQARRAQLDALGFNWTPKRGRRN